METSTCLNLLDTGYNTYMRQLRTDIILNAPSEAEFGSQVNSIYTSMRNWIIGDDEVNKIPYNPITDLKLNQVKLRMYFDQVT